MTVNAQSDTDSFTFNGVKQGYYWLEFSAHVGTNATRGTARSIQVENQRVMYYVTASITAGLATAKINITTNTPQTTSQENTTVANNHMTVNTQATRNWTLVESSITIHGEPAYIGQCYPMGVFCGTSYEGYSLTVDLINYNGTMYYSYSGSITGVRDATIVPTVSTTNNTITETYTAWFTNSSLYCVSPAGYGEITCPAA